MVQRKPARKKPKDPGVALAGDAVPAGQARGGGDPGGRGGGGMAPASIPNYMRATSCSGARVGRAAAPAAAPPPPKSEPARAKVVLAAAPHVGRATCSSTLKGTVAAGGAHACPYAYCSFKGHVHAAAVPLGSFVASRRRLIKTQQSMKLKGASPFRKPNAGANADGYFVEIHAAGAGAAIAPTVSSDASCSDLSTEEMDAMVRRMEYVVFDHLSCGDDAEGRAKDLGASVDGSCGSSDVISDDSVELLGTAKHRGRREDTLVDHEDEDFGACKSDISEELDAKHQVSIPEDIVGDAPKESSVDSISSALSGVSFEDISSDFADAASSQMKKWSVTRRRPSEEGAVQMRTFRPKAPNFLPLESGPETEKVDLRHQTVDDRRAAEEWMVDFALRKAVKKLARAQKRKVEMLVQAFETVLPTVASDKKPAEHEDAKANFTLTKSSQACS